MIRLRIFHVECQLLLLQAADLERPPTQLEVETELATPGKSGRGRSSSSRGPHPNAKAGDRALAAVRSELHDVKGELEDMKAMVKLLLEEVRKTPKGGLEPAASSDVGADARQVTADKVAPASEPQATGKAAESGHTGSTTALEPLPDTNAAIGSQPECGKEKAIAKKRKGEASKPLEDRKARPTRRTLAKQTEVGL